MACLALRSCRANLVVSRPMVTRCLWAPSRAALHSQAALRDESHAEYHLHLANMFTRLDFNGWFSASSAA